MTDEQLREDVKQAIRQNDASADELRDLADRLETLADRYEQQEDVL